MTDQESFRDAIETAISSAKKTGKRYFILCPRIANTKTIIKNAKAEDVVFLTTPIVIEDCIEPEELQDVAFTVYPTGVIRYGVELSAIGMYYVSRHEGENDAKEAT